MKVPKLRVIPLAMSIAGLVHLGPASAEIISNSILPFDLTVFVPCANNGTGELVDMFGEFHVIVRSVISGSNNIAMSQMNQWKVTGTGRSTGYQYQGTGTSNQRTSFAGVEFPFTFTHAQSLRVLGQGSGNNFHFRFNMHETINGNGAVTASVDNQSATCK